MIARPRTYLMYSTKSFDGRASCYIQCHPQQRWEVVGRPEGRTNVELPHKNVTIVIQREDFEEHWKEVE